MVTRKADLLSEVEEQAGESGPVSRSAVQAGSQGATVSNAERVHTLRIASAWRRDSSLAFGVALLDLGTYAERFGCG